MSSQHKQAWLLLDAIRGGGEPDFETCLQILGDQFPLLHRLRETPQDPEWHAEGDVHIHTAMVLNALYQEMKREPLSSEERLTLVLAAILHDVAKPITTTEREIQGKIRVVSPGHEELGRSIVFQPLLDLGLPYELIRNVGALVGRHQLPKLLVVKERPASAFRKLARHAPMRLLHLLELADMKGRYCSDLSDQLDYLEFFKLECQNLGIWEEKAYANWEPAFRSQDSDLGEVMLGEAILDHETGQIESQEEGIARGYQFKKGFARMYVMVGISGAGKSTWIRNNLPQIRIVSLDDLREKLGRRRDDQQANGAVMQEARRLLKAALAAHETVVWDATNLRLDFRRQLTSLGRDYGALITFVHIAVSTEELRSGNQGREHEVAASVQNHQIERFEWPWEEESHRTLVVGKAGEILYRSGFLGPE